uniref:Probable polygalacturonase At3g15720 n=1 Tax=Tanacetum cinerariifolium TaxID=118510 RepID=A0A6L2JQ36_TANCI|nr:probable polygalacturonase At3g15720 [Tanacetum cinerariifolium]
MTAIKKPCKQKKVTTEMGIQTTLSANTFNVTSYGAVGDGNTDDSQAFIKAWTDLCGDDSQYPQLIIPPDMTFLLSPVSFNGPCKSSTVHIQLLGSIIAPKTRDGWKDCVKTRFWIYFTSVSGLTIDGTGTLDGQGSIWWDKQKARKYPEELRSKSDDCVAINGGIYDINVTRVFCGPGHGISIGSLGENGGNDTVELVRVQNCTFTGTENGLRIKTVPGGTGYARRITFQDINLYDVKNPIIIDQHYCSNSENSECPAPPSEPAVQVSDVTYININGTSASKQAITFSCSEKFNCTGINTNEVGIFGEDNFAYCKNAQGNFVATTPYVNCN